MEMRIATVSSFEPTHTHEWLVLVVWNNGGHHDAHQQFRPDRKQGRNHVRIVSHELKSRRLSRIQQTSHSRLCQIRGIEPMEVVERVVLGIQRPPHRRDTPVTNPVLHLNGPAQQTNHRISQAQLGILHKGRSPRQRLHRTVQNLLLLIPVRHRGSHVLTNAKDLPNDHALRVLGIEELPQSTSRENLAPNDSVPKTPHGDSMNLPALHRGLHDQERIHQGVHEPVPIETIHHPAIPQSKQMLHMLLHTHRPLPVSK